ncbi:DNA binding protein [Trametes elegans]|nr:DNA binding protein [Trametes elegans]
MKLLQIQDNGCGIRKDDLPILAERFTTSKLSTFSDLSRLTTYGFRGEALASISYVSNLTVVTKTKTDTCAWKACYADGALAPIKTGASADPKPCAGNDGTTITVENLFYNTPTRLSALRGSSEEYTRILDVVTKYAIHNPHVSFTCKKTGSPSPDVSTPSSSTIASTIRLLYGQTLAKELLHVSASPKKGKNNLSTSASHRSSDEEEVEDVEFWSAEAHFTNANYQAKKMTFLLFINHRLVESSRIKKALEAVYNGVIAKGTSPFVYLSLQIDPRAVDVNVHPTKKEVHFLNEDAIIERIADVVQQALIGQSQSRVFEYQTLLTGGIAEAPSQISKGKRKAHAEDALAEEPDAHVVGSQDDTPEGNQEAVAASQPAKRKVYSQHKVRTSLKERTLDSMFPIAHPSQQSGSGEGGGEAAGSPRTPPTGRDREIKESQCFLKSVKELRSAVHRVKHNQLSEILSKHTFVGVVDATRCLSLVQHGTRLYLLNHGALAAELFYQLGLRQFGNIARIRLDPPPSLRALVALAVDSEDGVESSGLKKADVVDRIVSIVTARRDMLQEYFSLGISEDGQVETLPMLLRDYTPNLDKLPLFLMRLGPQVDWTAEQACFETFLHELASFYVPEPLFPDEAAGAGRGASGEPDAQAVDTQKATLWQVQHVLFPAMARYLVPPKSLLDRDVVQVADLPDLYRVFERC